MSHQPERAEKNCLNCGTIVAGRYCQKCGQENVETRESFWSLISHFVFDILHFDGNFFSTTGRLFSRPGYVARQYAEGRRASFLHPIRMYLFTSAIFFLLFFSLSDLTHITMTPKTVKLKPERRAEILANLRGKLALRPADTSLQGRIARLSDTARPIRLLDLNPASDQFFSTDNRVYHTIAEYDSVQKTLPSGDRDNWFERALHHRGLQIDQKYKDHKDEAGQVLVESFVHRLPYLFFFSLPFFALILKLLYIRRRNFYYSDHAILTLYHYILSFMLLMLLLLLNALKNAIGWSGLGFATPCLLVGGLVYLYLSMKKFYRQGFFKTTVKFVLLNVLAGFVVIVLFVAFIFFSLFQL